MLIFSDNFEESSINIGYRMISKNIIRGETDVFQALSVFSTTREELIDEVIKNTLAARLGCLTIDPANAKGITSYIYGTRHLRKLYLAKGWHKSQYKNIELVTNPNNKLQLTYQNVDIAANSFREPRSISRKGDGSAQLIEAAQGNLFRDEQTSITLPSNKDSEKLINLLWYLCVSYDEDRVTAELSLPKMVKNGNFYGFHKRIFLIEKADDIGVDNISKIKNNSEKFEIEPEIKRKK